MSDHERRVQEFKKNCKEARYAEHRKLALKNGRKRHQDHVIKQTNHSLNQLYWNESMKPYNPSAITLKFRTPVPTVLSQDELDRMQWMEHQSIAPAGRYLPPSVRATTEDFSDIISLPDTVKEEFSRFEPQIARLALQYERGNLTKEEYATGRKALTDSLEEARQYRDREGGGTEMTFEARPPDTVKPAQSREIARITDRETRVSRGGTPEVSEATAPETPFASQEMPY